MTRSVYIVGGAGSGKSTFMSQLLAGMGAQLGPLSDLHSTPNARGSLVTLRGHDIQADRGWGSGLYLGCMRDAYPGTDGLDRASSITGEEWLKTSRGLPEFIVGEGATLSTTRFMTALHEETELLLVHLHVEDWLLELRFAARGSAQEAGFVKNTITRSANMRDRIGQLGATTLDVDTSEPADVQMGVARCLMHLLG